MRRHCNGKDMNLLRRTRADGVDYDRNDPPPDNWNWGEGWRPDDCGRVFDDVHYSTIHPHVRL